MDPHRCRHQYWAAPRAELVQSLLAVSLGTIAMDTGAGIALTVQEILQGIGSLLGFHKHQCQGVLTWGGGGGGRGYSSTR